jgi:hypothetical protein
MAQQEIAQNAWMPMEQTILEQNAGSGLKEMHVFLAAVFTGLYPTG